jgi:hypothetical protein
MDTSSTHFIENRLSPAGELNTEKPEALAKMSAAAPYDRRNPRRQPKQTALQEAHHKRKSPVA